MWLFDFDGVLMDSVREVLVTGYNAVTGSAATDLTAIPDGFAERFMVNRFHALDSADIHRLAAWLLADRTDAPTDPIPAVHWQTIRSSATVPGPKRSRQFFTARKRFMKTNFRAWLDLHQPFQPLWETLSQDAVRLVLLTSKNREATLALCRHFGMAVPEANIYSGDNGTGKPENFRAIHDRFRQPCYRFLDDALANLRTLDVAFNTDDRCIVLPMLADWGYVGPEAPKAAANMGYPVLNQAETVQQVLQDRFAEKGTS